MFECRTPELTRVNKIGNKNLEVKASKLIYIGAEYRMDENLPIYGTKISFSKLEKIV